MKNALYKSIALHLVVLILFLVDIPVFWRRDLTINQVPIIVDLNNVKLSDMTNLPPKAKRGAEEKQASKIKRKIEKNYTKDEPSAEPEVKSKPEEAKEEIPPAKQEKVEKPKQDFLVAPQPKKPKVPVKKQEAKPAPKPKPKPKTPEKPKSKAKKEEPKLANPLKSLLASVDALEKEGEKDQTATIKEDAEVNNMGIEGGVGGSYFSELSISETDAIAGRLRACWNLDPGAMGIQDMIIEIRAYLNKDGTVREVKILDTSRYNSDRYFRSVADSARRAVYICQDAYAILAQKYPEKYDLWNTMLLRFNPLDASVN